MSDIEIMQKLLDTTLVRIGELEDSIKECKSKKGDITLELRSLKKSLSVQQRVKLTLIQSIQDLKPSTNTMTLFSPLKSSGGFFSRVKNFFRGASN